MLHIHEYQQGTDSTAFVYRDAIGMTVDLANRDKLVGILRLNYLALKLNGEAGEVAEHIGKALRDDEGEITPDRYEKIMKELGDILWYISQICNELEADLEVVMDENLKKLQSRKDRGVLGGSGSDR